MKILVLNANGKVGHEVARQLLAAGKAVRIGARDTAKAKKQFPGAEIVAFDYGKPDTVKAALAGMDSVFTAVPYELLPGPELDLVASATSAGVKRIVKLSAIGADTMQDSPHATVEKAIEGAGLAYTFLRPNFFMQNYTQSPAATIRDHGAFYEPAADGASSFIDARDIAAVAVKALTEEGHNRKAYTLTGGEALTRQQLADTLTAAIGKPVKYVAVDDAALRSAMAAAPKPLTELMSVLFGLVRVGHTAGVSPDVEKVLGRKPTTFASFARDYAAAWK